MRIELDRNVIEHFSYCCKYAFYDDTDICILCGEHSPPVCPLCHGEEQIEEYRGKTAITRHTKIMEITTCPRCKGEGWVGVDI